MLWFHSIKSWWEFRRKKKLADRLHEVTGKQYFVIPVPGGGLTVINNEIRKGFNKNNKKGFKMDYKQLCEMAYYKTRQGTLTR